MKKNLKKVISAVLSLTLALSSFVALSAVGSAATFTDVADTASYSEAVEALAALGAISGYEDGTFLPNNNITRAEVTTMIVAALNMSEDAKNSGSTTQFADVNANAAWAAGYVNIGVAQGFISGMSATEFAPAENVTYAQVLTMLTRILGYGDFAESRGGYPNGYLTAASTAGILSGVSASANDAMTRAQVAQLIWNAVQAPMLDITTFSTSTTGQEMQKMDGKNDRDFKTVLSDKFDAYVLNITVEKTSKSDSALNAGKIQMKLTSSNDWDPETEQLVSKNTTGDNLKDDVAAGKTVAESYLFSSAKVVAEYNDDDEWTLLYFAPTTKVTQKEVDGTLVADYKADDDTKSGVTADYIRIKKSKSSSTTTNYKLDDAELYVNGVKYADITAGTAADVQKILAASTGNTVLVESQNKSGYYDKVMVDFYAIGRVTQVNVKSASTTLSIGSLRTSPFGTSGSKIEINNDDLETGDVTLSVTKANAAAELSSLVKDDVVAVKYDVTNKNLNDSNFYEIIASTDTVTGKYSGYDEEDKYYSLDGQNYEAAADLNFEGDLESGVSYTLYLDPFGKIFDYEEEASTKNFAIVERYIDINETTSSSSEYSYINVMTLDGQSKVLYIDGNYEDKARTVLKTMGILNSVGKTANAVSIDKRIIEYTVKNSNGRINKIQQVTDVVELKEEQYKESSNKLGKTLSSSAAVLDATDYDSSTESSAKTSDYKASSLAGLTNDVEYDGWLVYKNSNGEYGYVIITSAGSTFGGSSDFVVAAATASESSQKTTEDGEEVYAMSVMQNGDDKYSTLEVSKSVDVYYAGSTTGTINYTDIKKGAIFYYTTDSDNLVDEIYVVYNGNPSSLENLYTITTADLGNVIKLPAGDNVIKDDEWKITLREKDITGDTAIQLLIAPVIKSSTSSVTVAPIYKDTKGYYFAYDEDQQYNVNSNSKIYSYDLSGDRIGREAFSSGSFNGSIKVGDVDSNSRGWLTGADSNAGELDFSESIQMAFMMVVDGVVTNALVFED